MCLSWAPTQAREFLKKFPIWFRQLTICIPFRNRLWLDCRSNCSCRGLINCVCIRIDYKRSKDIRWQCCWTAGSIALAAGNSTEPYKQPKIEEMNYVLLTDSENISVPINEPLKLWKHKKFDAKKKVVILVTGWNSDIEDENTAASSLWEAYKSRGDTNFVLIDTARYVDTLYAWSAFNTQDLGTGLGKGIAKLISVVPLEKIHLMGHSLGYVLLRRIKSNYICVIVKLLILIGLI